MSDLTLLVTPLRAGLKVDGRTTLDVLVQVQGPPTPEGIKTERPPLNGSSLKGVGRGLA